MNSTATGNNPIASELYKQFKMIDDNYSDLQKACTNESQLEQLKKNHDIAFHNYNVAINKDFDSNDKEVAELQDQLEKESQKLSDALADIKSIPQTINTIASAVSLGASLIS